MHYQCVTQGLFGVFSKSLKSVKYIEVNFSNVLIRKSMKGTMILFGVEY